MMAGLYSYCVVPAGTAPPENLVGLSGRIVHARGIGPFDVWVSETDAQPRMDLDGVETHHRVVVAAMALATPVPVRFGAWAPDPSVLEERVLARRAEIEAAQEQVRGMVELSVRIDRPSAHPLPRVPEGPRDGRAYLRRLAGEHEARRQRRGVQDEVAGHLRRCLGAVPAGEKVRLLEEPGLLSAAHLVERDAEGEYRQGVEDFTREAPSFYRVRVTGPWPPYSFAS